MKSDSEKMGYKGKTKLDAGYIYLPYIPIFVDSRFKPPATFTSLYEMCGKYLKNESGFFLNKETINKTMKRYKNSIIDDRLYEAVNIEELSNED